MASFLPYLFSSPGGLWYVFQYHLERPLQIESVLGTPMLFGKLIGVSQATFGHSHGTHMLVRRRPRGHGLGRLCCGVAGYVIGGGSPGGARPGHRVLALILALMTFGKVLSPQYLVWTLPACALAAARDRAVAILGGLTLLGRVLRGGGAFGRLSGAWGGSRRANERLARHHRAPRDSMKRICMAGCGGMLGQAFHIGAQGSCRSWNGMLGRP